VLIEQNVVENVNTGEYSGEGRLVMVLNNVSNLVIRGNTMTAPGKQNTFLTLGRSAATGFMYRDNLVSKGQYGLFGDSHGEGADALDNINPPLVFENNVIIGSAKVRYPQGARFVSDLSSALALIGAGADAAKIATAVRDVLQQ